MNCVWKFSYSWEIFIFCIMLCTSIIMKCYLWRSLLVQIRYCKETSKYSLVITARIRRMGEGNIFTLCVSPHLNWRFGGGRLLHPANEGGGTPCQVWTGGGIPFQVCTRSTHYYLLHVISDEKPPFALLWRPFSYSIKIPDSSSTENIP